MQKLTLVTGNPDKLKEYRMLLVDEDLDAADIDLPEIQAATVEEVALDKARRAFERLQRPVIVEDAGFALEAWRGLPGPYIKYFEQQFPKEAMVRLLRDGESRRATAVCSIAYCDGEYEFSACGEVSGVVSDHMHEGEGFGFDFYFIPDGHEQTFSEMGLEQKSEISHRRQAIEAFKAEYKKHLD